MYAIVQCGGHQVSMIPGSTLVVDHLEGEEGAEVSFDQVLMVEKDGGELMAGSPFLANARVVAVVDGVARGPKSGCSRRSGAKACGGPRAIAAPTRASGQGHRGLG